MGNAASNEAQQPKDATALGRPRSHAGATSQPATPGGSSLGRGWSRHGSIRRGVSQTPVQNPTRNPFSREDSAGPSLERQLSTTTTTGSTSAQARRPRADSASTATGPRAESLTPNASRERAATASFDTPLTKPGGPAGRSASISVGLSSHLLKRPTKQGTLQSSDLQDTESELKEHPGSNNLRSAVEPLRRLWILRLPHLAHRLSFHRISRQALQPMRNPFLERLVATSLQPERLPS
ncbi:hypothetical protein BCV69DRAFT_38644 [Microstroma glucosiphilum]|uniref:Uncharacterized protein n=1 Tax=Pseudomicrostroma glucosiphilum TaxID=1684307 RepID=A0A316U2K4_9BASI|nr:hypothetical protein BCV69DRAFT_38644 [Pseudomicrostroma glucosiphilum]PWN19420.1 hypothetical protein BCV69DRAFT_38644 [Pseudomicrostroma glucosiphilum]